MSVIEAAAMRCRTMADGSLRIEVEVEPRHAQDAFRLFGSPGTPMALAALKTGAAAHGNSEARESTPVTGLDPPAAPPKKAHPIVEWLGLRCKEPEFQEWVQAESGVRYDWDSISEENAVSAVYFLLGVQSRAKVPGNPEAERRFVELRKNYAQYKRKEVV